MAKARSRLKAALTCCLLAPAWLGPTCPKFSRRAIGIIIPLTILGPTESGADVHVVRPQNVTDGAFYSFDVPDSFKAVNRAKYQRDRQLLGKTAEYVSDSGARVFTGESPSEDFVKRRRLTVPRSQQKVLKYVLGEKEDLLECIVKEPQEDGGEMLKHRWWRVLKDGGTSAIMDLDLKEDQLKEFGPEMEVIWGGQGTLMRTDEADFMRRWTPVVRQLAGPSRMSGSKNL
ncbi:Hypothetical protein SCF082_LOCUS29300 [Durusdinium trenchii]|uniref:Uncharacterized protein n=1 Tax=Durusdinium trenchii TaxID=1381693 RepID=A0ABP0MRW0_9DINO